MENLVPAKVGPRKDRRVSDAFVWTGSGRRFDLWPGALLFAGHSTRTPSSGQFHWPRRPRRHRLPPGDNPHALASLGVVADEWEVAAKLDHAGKLAAFIESAADRFGGGLVHGKHAVPGWDGDVQKEGGCTTA